MIAGYPWFTDWGRDTMISLEGLTLVTGRHSEAHDILRTFALHVRHGLIPNLFPEGQREGLYHTADATLWFFHALHRYDTVTGDHALVEELLPVLQDIVRCHRQGTAFNIHVDADGLLAQGAPGVQLTWMDALVDGWVVTPRRGKAVEINALWHNALVLLAGWLDRAGLAAERDDLRAEAAPLPPRVQRAVLEPGDAAPERRRRRRAAATTTPAGRTRSWPSPCRTRRSIGEYWPAVLESVTRELATPVGLRTLSPAHPDYKRVYFGDLRARDAAYHQGTVWPWLMGPFVDAWLAVHPEDAAGARKWIDPLLAHVREQRLRRIDQRDLRRRAAVHAARLLRAGVERRRARPPRRQARRLRDAGPAHGRKPGQRGGLMRRLLPVLREALDHWLAHSTPQTAAGLAYYTVFSLAPLLLIAIGIAGIVLGQDQAREQIVRQATSLVGAAGRAAVEGMLGDASEAPKAGLVGTAVGFLTLLIGAVGVLAQLKFALNTVWHVEAPPFSWGGLVTQYLSNMALVVATGFLLLVSLVATAAIGVATARLRSWLAGPDVLWVALDAGAGFVMTAALFGLIFKTLPDAPVHWRDVRVGAFVTAALFTAGRLALGWYLGREGGDSAYAAAASLLALLAWVYYSSQLVLFGAEFTVLP